MKAIVSRDSDILRSVAQDAKDKRGDLISLYKAQGQGNVILDLVHGFQYKYGETIPDPQIMFNDISGNEMGDFSFWEMVNNL